MCRIRGSRLAEVMLLPRTGSRRPAPVGTRAAALRAPTAAAAETIGIPCVSLTPAEVRKPLGSARVFKVCFTLGMPCGFRLRKQLDPIDACKLINDKRVQNTATALILILIQILIWINSNINWRVRECRDSNLQPPMLRHAC